MMAISPFSFTPEIGFADSSAYPNDPGSEEAAREQLQRPHTQTKTYLNATLIPALTAQTAASDLGASSLFEGDITAPNIQAKLLELRKQLVNLTLAGIADGSVTTVKLSPDLLIDEGGY